MLPLSAVAPDLGSWRRVTVHRDCHVKFDEGLYSAPFTLVGKVLWLRATDSAVALFEDYRHVHTHARVQRRGERRTVNDHMPPQARAFFAGSPLGRRAGRQGRLTLRRADRGVAQRPHLRAAARGPRRAAARQALRPGATGSRLRPSDGPRQPVLPHGQDHPGRRRRPAAAPRDPYPERVPQRALCALDRRAVRPARPRIALTPRRRRGGRSRGPRPALLQPRLRNLEPTLNLNPIPELAPQLKQLRLMSRYASSVR